MATTRLYIFESGNYSRWSHFDISDSFIAEMNRELNLETDNEDGIEITIEEIKDTMMKDYGEYPLIMLKDHYDGEFELHDFISDYMYDHYYYENVVEEMDCDAVYTEWSEK